MNTTVALAVDVEAPWRTALEALPEVTLLSEAPASALLTEDGVLPLDVLRVSGSAVEHLGDQAAAGPGRALLLIVEAVLDDQDAFELEDRNIAYADADGRAWVPGAPRSVGRESARRRMRTASTRAAQLLADHPDEHWAESTLSVRAEVSSGTAHNLLRQLVTLGLVERLGRGRTAYSKVRDTRGLRRWLVEGSKPDSSYRVSCYVRNVDALPAEIDDIPLIRSGAEGARRLGLPVLSSVDRVMVRVPILSRLEDLPARLRGIRTTTGANVLLVSDRDRFASSDARMMDGVLVAPPSRIALDLKLEPRGGSASSVFLDLWGDDIL